MTAREPLCRGRRCVVVGSAPGVTLPEPLPGDVVLGANGGAAIARDSGRTVDILCTTAFLFRPERSEVEVATAESLRRLGVDYQSVWIDTQAGAGGSVISELGALGVRADMFVLVPPAKRSAIVRAATGEDLRVSTGVFAACLARVSGASEIVLCGIDPGTSGHEGVPWDEAPRDHVPEDSRAISALSERAREVYRDETDTTRPGDTVERVEPGPLRMEFDA